MSLDDKKIPEESLGKEKKNFTPEDTPQKTEKVENPLGDGVKIAMYIIYNEKFDKYGIVATPGFLDVPDRAYYALRVAEKNLDEFYFKKRTFQDKMMEGIKNFNNKMNFRNFYRGHKR